MRVVIVEDSPIVRQRLEDLLGTVPGMNVVGQAEGVSEAMDVIGRTSPDVVILDLRLKDGTGMMVLEMVKKIRPATRVVAEPEYEESWDEEAKHEWLAAFSATMGPAVTVHEVTPGHFAHGRMLRRAVAPVPGPPGDHEERRQIARVRGQRIFWDLAGALVPRGRGYDFNQALMDFGATWCTARKPRCAPCPMKRFCATYRLA